MTVSEWRHLDRQLITLAFGSQPFNKISPKAVRTPQPLPDLSLGLMFPFFSGLGIKTVDPCFLFGTRFSLHNNFCVDRKLLVLAVHFCIQHASIQNFHCVTDPIHLQREFSWGSQVLQRKLGSKSVVVELILVAAETPRVDEFYFHVQDSSAHCRRNFFIRAMVSNKLEFNGRLLGIYFKFRTLPSAACNNFPVTAFLTTTTGTLLVTTTVTVTLLTTTTLPFHTLLTLMIPQRICSSVRGSGNAHCLWMFRFLYAKL
jgi:hypothetical protein